MRFSADKWKNMDSFTFLAFSAGPRYVFCLHLLTLNFFRNCIGQRFALHQLKVTLANILNRLALYNANYLSKQ